ncbi:MAG: right-handed parallel beta-helix repeat-containing protein [Acidobacteria bacterium]|nr:right-handed parallel beta-helix repeat-containing protein [Acidobacteriota bacterium]
MKQQFLLMILGFMMAAGTVQTVRAVPAEVTACGQVLAASGEYVLANNLNCSGTGDYNGVTIIASSVTLHLAGRTVASTDCDLERNLSGIFVAGGLTDVKIDGGAVSGFNNGIVLSSSNSVVEGVTVSRACQFGIAVQGSNNVVRTNTITANGDGVALSPAVDARVASNNLSGNNRAGVVISDTSAGNIIEDNVLNNNGADSDEGYGVAIFSGSGNTVRRNAADRNDFGIRISSPGNQANNNTVSGNSQLGIWVSTGGVPASVRRNSVFGNGLSDMFDESAACGGNLWRGNRFMTDLVNGAPNGGPDLGCLR